MDGALVVEPGRPSAAGLWRHVSPSLTFRVFAAQGVGQRMRWVSTATSSIHISIAVVDGLGCCQPSDRLENTGACHMPPGGGGGTQTPAVLITSAPGADWPSSQYCLSLATPPNVHSRHTPFSTAIGVFA